MYGFDFFFKTAAAGMKVAQKSVENMFRLMEMFLQQEPRSENKGAEQEMEASSEKAETKEPAPKRYVGARSETIRERAAVSAKKAPESKEKTIPEQKPTPSTAKSAPPQTTVARTGEPVAAIEVVKRLLSEKKKPLKTEEIMKATGFNRKKVQDNLYKLKKRGEIKMVEKGVYVKR